MNTEMGEYIVGACLKLLRGCDFVDYNVRRPGGGLAGLNEIDVVGLDFKSKTAYLCEVTTHLDGLLYVNAKTTLERINKKYEKLMDYAKDFLSDFPNRHFMFWSPVVRESIASELEKIDGLELIINKDYTAYVGLLQELAKKGTHDTGNPTFRVLQILGHLR
jgi:Holliday junction resolvase-like predicted endonuclease